VKVRGSPMTPAMHAANAAGVEYSLHRYTHCDDAPSFGLEAAEQLQLPPAQVFKTLVVDAGDNRLALAVVPVDARLDLKALAAVLEVKRLRMAEPRAAERATGYVRGGISPLGQRRSLATVIDATAFAFDTVYVSGGRRGLDIGLAPRDLQRLCAACRAPIARRGG